MSAIEKINQLSHRIFNTSVTEQNVARTSNPFAASNFQKNILTEDVFESSKKKEENKISFTGNLKKKKKRVYSTFVGSINDFGSRFYEGIQSLVSLGNKMKEGIVNTWNKIHELGQKEVSLEGAKDVLSRDIKTFFINGQEREISKMSKMDPISEVKPMFSEALSALEADMVMAA